jgi:hypothetical protein
MNRVLGLIAAILILSTSIISYAEESGFTFSMTMQSPGQDDAIYAGASLGDDMSLKGKVGEIETITLLSSGKLYVLTPAIRTARELENPDSPPTERDSADWSDWLLEPGRVNPLKFAEVIGEEPDLTDQVHFGAGSRMEAKFESGRLVRLSFPSPSGEGDVVYSYSDFTEAPDLKPEDFQVPSSYSD